MGTVVACASADVVDQAITTCGAEVQAIASLEFRRTIDRWLRQCRAESPLEEIFLVGYAAATTIVAIGGASTYELQPQHSVVTPRGTYRLDFAIVKHWVAIELDGHEFHEKTREQVAARNQRDRDLQLKGWYVLHFSWSEMTSNPLGCALEVLNFAKSLDMRSQTVAEKS